MQSDLLREWDDNKFVPKICRNLSSISKMILFYVIIETSFAFKFDISQWTYKRP